MSPAHQHLVRTIVVLFLVSKNHIVNAIFAHSLRSPHLEMIFEPVKICNFIITASSITNSGVVLTMGRLVYHSARLERTVQVFSDPARYDRRKTPEKYSCNCYVQLQVTLEMGGGKIIHNPLMLSNQLLGKFNNNANIYFDIFLVFFVASPAVPADRHWLFVFLGGYCLRPSNTIWYRISAPSGMIFGAFQLETIGGATPVSSLRSNCKLGTLRGVHHKSFPCFQWYPKPGTTIADYRSKATRTKMNYNGFPAVIGYLEPRAYYQAAGMTAVQIIDAAYPWQVLMKVIQGLIERYNVTLVNGKRQITNTCTPFAIVLDMTPTESFDSSPTLQFLIPDMDACGALYHDRVDTLPPHPFYDLTAPFSKFLWVTCIGSMGVIAVLFYFAYDMPPLTAFVMAVAPLVNVVFRIRTQKSRLLFMAWAGGGGLISAAYVSTLQSYVTVPKETSTLKSVRVLMQEIYRIFGVQEGPTFGLYNSAYGQLKRRIGNDPSAENLLRSYEELLSIYDNGSLKYFDQYVAMRDENVALFGELHELNVIRGTIPPNERKRYNLVNETFFPKVKNWIFQLPHADVFVSELNWLVSTGIHRWWENVRGMANRLRWRRVLKHEVRKAEQHRQSVAFDDPLSLAIFYCWLLGLFMAISAFLLELMQFCASRKRWSRADRVEMWIQVKEISEGRYR